MVANIGSQLSTVLSEMKTAFETIETSPGVIKYTVKKDKIDEKLVESTTVPCVLISSVRTRYGKQQFKQIEETYEISLLIIVDKLQQNDALTGGIPPLEALELAQNELTQKLFKQFVNNASSIVLKDSFEMRTSSISNATKQHNFGSAVHCVLEFVCSALADYSS